MRLSLVCTTQEVLKSAGNNGRRYPSSIRCIISCFLRVPFVRNIWVIVVNTPSPLPSRPYPTIPLGRTKKESFTFQKSHAQCKQGSQR